MLRYLMKIRTISPEDREAIDKLKETIRLERLLIEENKTNK